MTEAVIIQKPVIDLRSKSIDWFLYDNGLRHERVNRATLVAASVQDECLLLYFSQIIQILPPLFNFYFFSDCLCGSLFAIQKNFLKHTKSSFTNFCHFDFFYELISNEVVRSRIVKNRRLNLKRKMLNIDRSFRSRRRKGFCKTDALKTAIHRCS